MTVAERLRAVHARIAAAAAAASRAPSSVRLVAVSKTKPASMIREAYAAGQRDFGENYVQELEAKAVDLSDLPGLCFHAIGHLQRNKVKVVIRRAGVLHTLDSVRLIREVAERAAQLPAAQRPAGVAPDGRYRVLLEVNVGGEAQKSGCAPADLGELIAEVERSDALVLSGLMTVPPHTDAPAGARPYFDRLVQLRDQHGGAARLPELSMGMTQDLEQAIASGATLVRVGSAIFGERER